MRPRASKIALMPATPIAVSVMPARQGRPIESLMMTPTVTPRLLAQRVSQRLRGRVRVRRQQGQFVAGDVRGIDTGRGHHQSVPGLHDAQVSAGGDHADRLGVDGGEAGRLAGGRVVAVESHQLALDLGDHLRRHDQHVAVAQLGVGDDHRGEVVARVQLADAGDRQDLEVRGRMVD